MPIIEETIDIAAGPADVFRFCHDAKSRPEWDEQVLRVELLSPAPMRLGTLLRVDAKPASGSSVFTWDAEVVSYHFPMNSTVRVLDTAFSSPFGPGMFSGSCLSSSSGIRYSASSPGKLLLQTATIDTKRTFSAFI